MQPCVTRVRHSSCLISVAVPHAAPHAVSNSTAQFTPSLRIHSPKSPERMSSRRLSWRRKWDTSTSSQPSASGQHLPEPAFPQLHRSLSEVSPVSPLSDRNPIIEADSRRLSRIGFVRRSAQDNSFISPAVEHISYTGPFYGLPSIQTPASRGWQEPRPEITYAQDPYTGYRSSSHDLHNNEDRSTSGSRTLSQQTFMTSPTSYASSNPSLFAISRPHTSSRMSRPPSAPYSTYPPVRRTTLQRDTETMDEFTSPTDFALFAEATSSLDITPLPSPNPARNNNSWSQQQQTYNPHASASLGPSYPYRDQQQPTSNSRLAAPLPPMPRTRSSPASVPALVPPPSLSSTTTRRQPSRSQMIAEALTGMGIDDRLVNSDDDEELPNYEQSQAEVAARKRREASNRARELEESWARARRRGT